MEKLKKIFKQKSFDWDDWDNSDAGSIITLSGFPKEFRTRKLIKYSSKAKAIKAIFQEYCDNSTIHGVRYLSEEKRPKWEKIIWILIFSISIYFCTILIHKTWIKWDQNPVIVSFSEKSTPVWNIPFPALTICPEAKTQQEIFNFTKAYKVLYNNRFENGTVNLDESIISQNETSYVRALLQVCSLDFVKHLKFPKNLEPIDIFKTLEEFEPDFNTTYPFCRFKNKVYNCENLDFFKVFTSDGICYSFNGLPEIFIYREQTSQYEKFKETYGTNYSIIWNLENGYNESINQDMVTDAFKPVRVFSPYHRGGFFIALQAFEQNRDHMCTGAVKGFRVLLHSPDDAPYLGKNFVRVPLSQEILIRINPNIIQTSESLRYLSPLKRQCFFSNERSLKYFKIYSQSNCELECLADITLKKCGCVKFSMPREPQTRVCDVNEISCYNEAENDLLQLEFDEGHKTSGEFHRGETSCNCLPSCTTLTYEAEITHARADFEAAINAQNESEHFIEFPGSKLTRLSIYFKELQYITTRRSELYGITDFLANCGGLFALFMGISALSFIELLYHCSIRLIMNLKMRKETQKICEDLQQQDLNVEFQAQYNDLFNKYN